MTIHGKSRYPGLFVWTRQGKRVQVKVPEGCLLIQAGKQLEYLTGGHVMCGFHEVVVCEGTLEAMRRAKYVKNCRSIRSMRFKLAILTFVFSSLYA